MSARVIGPAARRGQLALALGLLALTLTLAVLDARSGVARLLRSGSPFSAVLALRGENALPSVFATFYHPIPRSLVVLELPSEALYRTGYPTIEAAEAILGLPQPHLRLSARVTMAAPGSAEAFRYWALNWPRGLGYWLAAARGASQAAGSGAISAYDAALLALEAYRLGPEELRLASLPAPSLRPRLVELLLSALGPRSEDSALRVEVLNASGESGIALQAAKVLRWHRVDVVELGNWGLPLAETLLVDRSGRPQDARRVAELLGCADAELWTRLEPDAPAPVSIVLGRDFRRCRSVPR